MTRIALALVIGCCALGAVAITAVLESDDLFSASEAAAPPATLSANSDTKRDKMPVVAAADPAGYRFDFDANGRFNDPARPADSPLLSPQITYPPPLATQPPNAQKAKPAKIPMQKNYSLMSEAQIAAIKARMKLTPQQETLWPPVEMSLRKLAKSAHERRLAATGSLVDLESDDVSELRNAAAPLLAKLRDDQKREVRSLARIIGLDAVASQF